MGKQPEIATQGEKVTQLENKLKAAQLAALTLQAELTAQQIEDLKKVKPPFYKDAAEVIKVAGAAFGLLAAVFLFVTQVVTGNFTNQINDLRRDRETLQSASTQLKSEITDLGAEKERLSEEVKQTKSELDTATNAKSRLVGFIPEVSQIPGELLTTTIDGINKDPKRWVTELVSDSHLLLMTFSAACGNMRAARNHLASAKTFDSGDTPDANFAEWQHDLDLIEQDLKGASPSC